MNAISKRPAAFSLAEVTIAVGIAAFGLVATLGLLARGLTTISEAGHIAAESRIAQFLVGEVLLNDWDSLDEYDNSERYFDAQGLEVIRGNANTSIYTAVVEIPAPDVTLPGAGGPEPHLRRVLVHIAKSVENQLSYNEDPTRFATYASIVANMKKSAP